MFGQEFSPKTIASWQASLDIQPHKIQLAWDQLVAIFLLGKGAKPADSGSELVMADADDFDDADIKRRMDGAISSLKGEFAGLRTGRASSSLLDPIMVDAYGAITPLNQVATVSVPEPRMISVQVWDKTQVAAVEKAIRASGLGLNPVTEGTLLRLPIPELNEERRLELAKVASKYAEQAKISVRNVRRDGMDTLKRMEKNGDMSEDDHKIWSDEVQSMTDAAIAEIEKSFTTKEAEITQI